MDGWMEKNISWNTEKIWTSMADFQLKINKRITTYKI